jgi:hypothetical protein
MGDMAAQRRWRIAEEIFGTAAFFIFGCGWVMGFGLEQAMPTTPDIARGLTIHTIIHGRTVYLTARKQSDLTALLWGSFALFAVAVVMMSQEPVQLASGATAFKTLRSLTTGAGGR